MSYLVHLILISIFLYGSSANPLETVNGTINLRLGTTSGCRHAANFITQQLVPTYAVYKNFLNIEFVPWGRTNRSDDGTLICQFGEADCWANRVQRCVINLLSGNLDAQVQYMACEFTVFAALRQRSLSCAQTIGLSLIDVDYCVTTTGDKLEAPAEELSTPAIATMNANPFIIFNNNIDFNQHAQALNRLESTICFALAEDPTTGITHCKI